VPGKFQKHVYVSVVLKEVEEPQNIWMSHCVLQLHLSVNLLCHVPYEERVFLHHLQSKHLTIPLILYSPNNCDRTFAQVTAIQ